MSSTTQTFRVLLVSASLLASQVGLAQEEVIPPSEPAPATSAPADATATPADATVAPAEEVAPPSKRKKAAEEDIVVTGSRIRRKDLTTPAPVVVVSKEQLEHSAYQTVGDYLNSMSQIGGASDTIGSQTNNGGDGATVVDLRGLGAERTLVLLNGRRIIGQGLSDVVDLNIIPTAAVERIEILLDGASGIYGSDAIGGVINIITKKTFDGSELYAYSGISGHGDGMVNDFRATLGSKGDKGNVLFSLDYYNQNPVFAGNRPYTSTQDAFQFTPIFGDPGGSAQAGGSTRIPAGLLSFPSSVNCAPGVGTALFQKLCSQSPGILGGYVADPTTALGFRSSTLNDLYNYQPVNYDVTPSQRITAFGTGDTHFTDNIRGYFEVLYNNRTSAQQLAPLPLDTGTAGPGITVSANSIYNPFGVPVFVSRRMVEWGPRITDQNSDTFQTTIGVDGTIPQINNWFWNVDFSYGRSDLTQSNAGLATVTGLTNAIGPSMLINGAPSCVSTPGDPSTVIAGCVPLNLLGGGGSVTPAMSNQPGLQYVGVDYSEQHQTQIEALANGDLFKLAAKNPVALAIGYQYRREYGSFTPNPVAAANNDATGENEFATAGGYYANELYAEVNAPIIDDTFLLKALEAIGALRYSNFNEFGGVVTGKVGLRWSPVKDLTFRGTYSTGYRAPSISDLYSGQAQGFPGAVDPCATLNASTPALVVHQCTSATPYGGTPTAGAGFSSSQVEDTTGGNPKLSPETSEQGTVGVVIQPRWVKGLSVTVDYYNFNIQNTIATLGNQIIMDECYEQGVASACANITRSATSHQIISVLDLNTNVGSELTDGWDFQAHYDIPTEDAGNFSLAFNSTYLNRFNETLPNGQVIHGAGNYDLGIYPNFKFNAGVSWSHFHGFGAGINLRFLNSLLECGTNSSGEGAGTIGGTSSPACYQLATNSAGTGFLSSQLIHVIPAYAQTDIYLTYEIAWMLGKTSIQAGINNLFDQTPSPQYDSFTPNADPSSYDLMGRFFYLKLTQKI